jgi:lipoprotein-releasing system ATP-binding protein
MTPLLASNDLHKHYRMGGEDLHILRGVDLSVAAGQWVAVLGASGSGKSTLLHLLGGLDRPDAGHVLFEGRDVFNGSGLSLDLYRSLKVGFVFQFYHLLPEFTALENVLMAARVAHSVLAWARVRGTFHRRAVDLMTRMGLGERLRHRPNRLSGGERQRVAIARALINQPAVLLADEPTGNLDVNTGGQIIDLLRQFHDAGQTIVMVTHDERVAAAADRRLRLESGRLKG